MLETLHEQLELSLYNVETSSYHTLALSDQTYPHWIMSYVQRGDVTTRSGGGTWQAHVGDMMLHPPHVPFSEVASIPGTHQWLLLDVTIALHIDLFRLHPVAPVVTLTAQHTFSQTFALLQMTWQEPISPWRNLRLSALTLQLCSLLLESWQCSGSVPRPDAFLTPQDRFLDVISYMSAHLDEKVTRDDLAALVHLHPGYFDRAFHAIYGTTPMQMVRDLRLRQARHLLETTDASLSTIAFSCGLGDAGYLTRVFRRCYGQTPGHYRQSAKSAKQSYISAL